MFKLIIGNKNYSSWSLRAWWYLKHSGIEFEEIRIPLFTEGWEQALAVYSPAGRVPVLIDGELSVWDTLSIIAYLREQHPDALGWPADRAARALARSLSAEMHSGFLAVREELPQNLRRRAPLPPASLSAGCRRQIGRIQELWGDCRRRYGATGSWLFGPLSIADVMYAPVALRFASYRIPVDGRAGEFFDAVLADPLIREWIEGARRESERLDFIDELATEADSPLTLG